MGSFPTGVLCGVVSVLLLDTLGSLLSQRLKFQYSRLSPISLSIWAIAALITSWDLVSDPAKSIGMGWLTGFVVGLFDSTVGWWISWQLGAGHPRIQPATTRTVATIIVRVTMFAAGVGGAAVLLLVMFTKLIAKNAR